VRDEKEDGREGGEREKSTKENMSISPKEEEERFI